MGKLLSWLVLAAIGWLVWQFVAISQRKDALRRGPRPGAASRGRGEIEPMVACAHCGVYVPVSEAVVSGSASYCCAAHRDAHR